MTGTGRLRGIHWGTGLSRNRFLSGQKSRAIAAVFRTGLLHLKRADKSTARVRCRGLADRVKTHVYGRDGRHTRSIGL